MSGTWKDRRHETLRARLSNGEVQYLFVERDPITNVVKILSRVRPARKKTDSVDP